jgi:hypothetical protein
MPGCAGCGCVEPWCRQCALFESCCSTEPSLPTKTLYAPVLSPYMCHMPCPSYSWFDHPNNVWLGVPIVQLVIAQGEKPTLCVCACVRALIFFGNQKRELTGIGVCKGKLIVILIRWIIEPTDAKIIRFIFLELNQSQHVSGTIMPIIRRTKTRLVKTSCEDACNIGRKKLGLYCCSRYRELRTW